MNYFYFESVFVFESWSAIFDFEAAFGNGADVTDGE